MFFYLIATDTLTLHNVGTLKSLYYRRLKDKSGLKLFRSNFALSKAQCIHDFWTVLEDVLVGLDSRLTVIVVDFFHVHLAPDRLGGFRRNVTFLSPVDLNVENFIQEVLAEIQDKSDVALLLVVGLRNLYISGFQEKLKNLSLEENVCTWYFSYQ